MLERSLVTHCSATLAGLKPACMFGYKCHDCKQIFKEIDSLNNKLNKKGVSVRIVNYRNDRALIYVYRSRMLSDVFDDPMVSEFLYEYGYDCSDVELCISRLSGKLKTSGEFPHEIGLFLGYPFEDVMGFIQNKGDGYKLCGHWKVYSDETAAKRLFDLYRKCRDVYSAQFSRGKDIFQLTVLS